MAVKHIDESLSRLVEIAFIRSLSNHSNVMSILRCEVHYYCYLIA